MGGLMILAGIVVSSLLWADLSNVYVVSTLLVTLGFGAIGFYDDYLKVTKQSDKGFSGKARLGIEFVIAGIAVYFMMRTSVASAPNGSIIGHRLPSPSSRISSSIWGCSSYCSRLRHRRRGQRR